MPEAPTLAATPIYSSAAVVKVPASESLWQCSSQPTAAEAPARQSGSGHCGGTRHGGHREEDSKIFFGGTEGLIRPTQFSTHHSRSCDYPLCLTFRGSSTFSTISSTPRYRD